ncbi:MAG: hypothetical protein ACUVUG_00410 [Candidatus Aminicenantia bacterium]
MNNVKQGTAVSAALFHLDSDSSVGPVSISADKDHESFVPLFEFTSSSYGWSVGSNKLLIEATYGTNPSVNFKVLE